MASHSLTLFCLLCLAACAASEAPPAPTRAKDAPPVMRSVDTEALEKTPCGAEGYQSFVGQPLASVTYPNDLRVRVLRPGVMVTMEYVAERMNIHIDEDGIVKRVICG
ncbi:MAG: I78 family peptidase inhibitor [Pseudomonadota bacterium]